MIGFSGSEPRPWLARLDPRVKLVWLVVISIASVLLERTSALVVLCLLSALPLVGMKMRRGNWLLLIGLLLTVAWGTLLSQAIFYAYEPRTTLWQIVPPLAIGAYEFPGVAVYSEGAVYGLAQSTRFLAVTLAGVTTYLSTSPERLLAALGRLRVPVSISFLTVTALRTLPQLLEDWRQLRLARRLRGYKRASVGWHRRVWDDLRLVDPLLAVSLRRAASLALAVSSRGFDPRASRTYYPAMTLRHWEIGVIVVLLTLAATLFALKVLHWLYVSGVGYAPGLQPLYDLVRRWL
ncbi:MAG: energy-coupling factor transporter transmembrane protein EcfT [Planctomycetales bacterium]|nr:energy-coupling factor transporter transmembrane protein EcfT [Planctomycetales bacterium]